MTNTPAPRRLNASRPSALQYRFCRSMIDHACCVSEQRQRRRMIAFAERCASTAHRAGTLQFELQTGNAVPIPGSNPCWSLKVFNLLHLQMHSDRWRHVLVHAGGTQKARKTGADTRLFPCRVADAVTHGNKWESSRISSPEIFLQGRVLCVFGGLPKSIKPHMALLRFCYRVLAAGRGSLGKACGYASHVTVIRRA